MGLVHILACLLEPFMPSFSVEVFQLASKGELSVLFIICFVCFFSSFSEIYGWCFQVFKQLNLPPSQFSLSDENGDVEKARRPWEILPAGHKIGKPEPLFKDLVNFVIIHLSLSY